MQIFACIRAWFVRGKANSVLNQRQTYTQAQYQQQPAGTQGNRRIAPLLAARRESLPAGQQEEVNERLELMRHDFEVRVFFVGADFEAQAGHESEHAGVVGEYQADDFAQAFFACYVHDGAHHA